MSKVLFPDSPPCYSDGLAIHFTAIVDKKHPIQCAITLDALKTHFAKDANTPLADVFSRNRSSIERIAERHIAQKRFENNRTILIRSSDC